MINLKNHLIQLATSPKVFSLESNLSYQELIKKSLKLKLPTKKSNWFVIVDDKGIESLMIQILACYFQGQSFLILNAPNRDEYPLINELIYSETDLRKIEIKEINFGFQTSGSSGSNKIIIHPIKNIFQHAFNVQKYLEHRSDELWYLCLPTYHIAGLSILFRALITKASVKKIKTNQLDKIKEKGIISIVAAQLPVLFSNTHINPHDLKVFIGGGKTAKPLLEELINKGFVTYTSYGMSETSSTFALKKLQPKDDLKNLGKPIAGGEVRIIDQRLALKTPTLFSGELKNNQVIRPNLHNGFFITNDLAKIQNGNIYLLGRTDQIFITGGKNISLNEVIKRLDELDINAPLYCFIHSHQKWGQSYSIVIEHCDEKIKHDIFQKITTNLTREYSPSKIYFMTKDDFFVGIKPSVKELHQLVFPPSSSSQANIIYLHGILGDSEEFDALISSLNEISENEENINKEKLNHFRINLPTPKENELFISYIERLHSYISKTIPTTTRPSHLVGFSLGGRLAFYLKYFYPESYENIFSISSQIISQEDQKKRSKLDNNRFLEIKTKTDLENWATEFFKLEIYGNFHQTESCRQKIKKIRNQDLNRLELLFKTLSVANQPQLRTNNISWGDQLKLFSGAGDLKYKNLNSNYEKTIKHATSFIVKNCAHAIHLENPKDLAKLIHQYLN